MNQNQLNDATAPRSVASSRLVLLWRKIFPPKPEAPCTICGKVTTESNMFDPTFFYHKLCMKRKREMEKEQAERREKIELIKTAIRELDVEKQHDKDQATRGA